MQRQSIWFWTSHVFLREQNWHANSTAGLIFGLLLSGKGNQRWFCNYENATMRNVCVCVSESLCFYVCMYVCMCGCLSVSLFVLVCCDPMINDEWWCLSVTLHVWQSKRLWHNTRASANTPSHTHAPLNNEASKLMTVCKQRQKLGSHQRLAHLV